MPRVIGNSEAPTSWNSVAARNSPRVAPVNSPMNILPFVMNAALRRFGSALW